MLRMLETNLPYKKKKKSLYDTEKKKKKNYDFMEVLNIKNK